MVCVYQGILKMKSLLKDVTQKQVSFLFLIFTFIESLDYLKVDSCSMLEKIKHKGFSWGPYIVVVTMLLCCLCGSSCYYRYKMSVNGCPPFEAPTYCPKFIFPRPEYF